MTTHIFADLEELSIAFAERWIDLALKAITVRGQFHVALTGGSTPKHLYERLASAKFADHLDWRRVHIYFGDERCVPPDHSDSNFCMANEVFLRHVPIPSGQIQRMHGESLDAWGAARSYAEILARQAPKSADGNVQFDLILLGLGPDGHVASLFPSTQALQECDQSVVAIYVEKLQAWRISVTLPVINNAREILMLVAGEGKAEIVSRALAKKRQSPPLPVQMISPSGGMEWYLDKAAARQLSGQDNL
jgi:6-phosphogluconolactonase